MTKATTERQRHKSANLDESGRQGMAQREKPISYRIMEITSLMIWTLHDQTINWTGGLQVGTPFMHEDTDT